MSAKSIQANGIQVNGIRVNGEELASIDGESIAALIERIGRDGRLVAVERNGEVVPRRSWHEVLVVSGDRIEVVGFVQGG